MKLWDKGISVDSAIEQYTIGRDREMDMFLAPYDVLGTLAHITMLEKTGLLSKEDLAALRPELVSIYNDIRNGNFIIEDGIEDVHSQVEMMLTRRLGQIGKKVHSGRSRNDQVLVDVKLYLRSEISAILDLSRAWFNELLSQSETYKDVIMPGYTHLQVAMPSSFGLWFGAYAESLTDDLHVLKAAWDVANQNPLGSAAGYGSSFPLDRLQTTELLGFEDLNYNVVASQMGRGKTERIMSYAMASIASTIAKFSYDACLYMCQNFGFISLPDNLTTGSSIMPHKKNPDVFELTRSKCNRIQALPSEIALMTNNLPSGYFRDLQLLKEVLFPAIEDLKEVLHMITFMTSQIKVRRDLKDDERYKYMYSVEEVNRLVLSGIPFRDAYRQVGESIMKGDFQPVKEINHTHQGSIGNLCTEQIRHKMERLANSFSIDKANKAISTLLHPQD